MVNNGNNNTTNNNMNNLNPNNLGMNSINMSNVLNNKGNIRTNKIPNNNGNGINLNNISNNNNTNSNVHNNSNFNMSNIAVNTMNNGGISETNMSPNSAHSSGTPNMTQTPLMRSASVRGGGGNPESASNHSTTNNSPLVSAPQLMSSLRNGINQVAGSTVMMNNNTSNGNINLNNASNMSILADVPTDVTEQDLNILGGSIIGNNGLIGGNDIMNLIQGSVNNGNSNINNDNMNFRNDLNFNL